MLNRLWVFYSNKKGTRLFRAYPLYVSNVTPLQLFAPSTGSMVGSEVDLVAFVHWRDGLLRLIAHLAGSSFWRFRYTLAPLPEPVTTRL